MTAEYGYFCKLTYYPSSFILIPLEFVFELATNMKAGGKFTELFSAELFIISLGSFILKLVPELLFPDLLALDRARCPLFVIRYSTGSPPLLFYLLGLY